MKNQTICLDRSIYSREMNITLETERLEGMQYAFYLEHKKGIEKEFYSDESKFTFNIPFNKGSYKATFFYKYGAYKTSYSKLFSINETGEVVEVVKTTIDVTDDWKIDYYNSNSQTTFIVFNAAGSTLDDKPFGLDYLLLKGFNVIACLQNNNHYQGLDFNTFKNLIEPITEDKEVILYGSSVGGYCALYFAGAVNGTVISAAPRNPAHPQLIKEFNKEFGSNTILYRHKPMKDNPKTNKRIYIIYDPLVEVDVFYINKLVKPTYSNINLIQSKHAGHQVLYHLNNTSQLSSLIESIVYGKQDNIIVDESKESCFSDAGKADYYFKLGDNEKAFFYAERALELGKDVLTQAHTKEVMEIHNRLVKEK